MHLEAPSTMSTVWVESKCLLGMIRKTFATIDPRVLKTMFISFVKQFIEIADPVWSPSLKRDINKLIMSRMKRGRKYWIWQLKRKRKRVTQFNYSKFSAILRESNWSLNRFSAMCHEVTTKFADKKYANSARYRSFQQKSCKLIERANNINYQHD